MRDNFTKKELINSIYMQIGFPKKIITERNVITFKVSKEFKNYINSNE